MTKENHLDRESPAPPLPRIGVLALQGDFRAHVEALAEIDVTAVEVRRLAALDSLDGLVIPGGETTALLRLLGEEGMDRLTAFSRRGAVLGTCAGLILLARKVTNPEQPSLGLLDVVAERNAYGRQVDSFMTAGVLRDNGVPRPLEMVFIRAPRIVEVGPSVEVLARLDGEPVFVRQGLLLGATFHPELTKDRTVHRELVRLAARAGARGAGGSAGESAA